VSLANGGTASYDESRRRDPRVRSTDGLGNLDSDSARGRQTVLTSYRLADDDIGPLGRGVPVSTRLGLTQDDARTGCGRPGVLATLGLTQFDIRPARGRVSVSPTDCLAGDDTGCSDEAARFLLSEHRRAYAVEARLKDVRLLDRSLDVGDEGRGQRRTTVSLADRLGLDDIGP